jgi:hypothetical protein
MIEDQLVEYISSQMKSGTSRDTIKNTLVTAGWQPADVEDTLQKVESVKMSQPITASPSAATSPISSISAKPAGPQNIKMSDLISTSDPITTFATSPTTSSASQKAFTNPKPVAEIKPGATSYFAKEFKEKPPSSHGALITEIILGVLVIGIGAFAGYLFFKDNALSSQVATLTTQNSANASTLTALQQDLTASTTAWMAQIGTVNGQSKDLQTELSFYAVPAGVSPDVTSTATLNGSVSGGGKIPYLITATYGAKIYISNSKDLDVVAALQPLVASSTAGSFTGTYLPGADSITLTAVNGTAL